MGLDKVYGIAQQAGGILNDSFPYPKVNQKFFEDTRPTRTKIRALPGMKNSQSGSDSTGGAANMDFDTVWACKNYSGYCFEAITLDYVLVM